MFYSGFYLKYFTHKIYSVKESSKSIILFHYTLITINFAATNYKLFKMQSKKNIKEAYKQKKFQIGVYQIRNTINNKVLIDSSVDLVAIWNRERFQLNFGNHPNTELQKDWKEYGEHKFSYEILAEINQKEEGAANYKKEAKELEKMYIEELQPFGEKGYNVPVK